MEINKTSSIYRMLESKFEKLSLHRPMHIDRFEDGTELEYDVTSIEEANKGKVKLIIEKFIGGGFAGQVYRVKITEINAERLPLGGLVVGKEFAMKILIPPSAFSKFFRNFTYWLGFQGPFQLQVNPAAERAGAMWQKLIKRGAKIRFGDEKAVNDIHATFIDKHMGSCGELSDWVEGRTWRLEVNDRLDLLKKWSRGKKVDPELAGSPEYRAKHKFMHEFVDLLHDMGAPEFARQYEWSTWKSQPNCLKRKDTEGSPLEGLIAVDFRAGLALLPFLPMSPGDFKLIIKGLSRGSLVQFDRGSIKKLEKFIAANEEEFAGLENMLTELKQNEEIYRNSIPDITHNHFRLFFSGKLWSTMISSYITGWRIRNFIDEKSEEKFRRSKVSVILFYLLGAFPFIGRFFRRIWTLPNWRKHYGGMLSSWSYLKKSFRGKFLEKIIAWYRAGRITDEKAEKFSENAWRCVPHLPLSILPAGIHKFFSDWKYFKERLNFLLLRPFRLYFNAEMREDWLREMVAEGKKKNLLTEEDANTIHSQIDEPFIQKYLKSLAVHVATLPITQVVSIAVAFGYVAMRPELTTEQAMLMVGGILAIFQVTPISPGSFIRGLYVVYLVIKERNFKDYNIAVFLGFFKYIGYLAFPVQMSYRYPALARFMAGHWATEAVHIIPVFGEHGALLEHKIFGLFYNRPLTTRRRMGVRRELRSKLKPRIWHTAILTLIASGIFGLVDYLFVQSGQGLPTLNKIWYLTAFVPLLLGSFITIGAGGMNLNKRIISGLVGGFLTAVLTTAASSFIGFGEILFTNELLLNFAWRGFIFTFLSVLGVIITELTLPEPKVK